LRTPLAVAALLCIAAALLVGCPSKAPEDSGAASAAKQAAAKPDTAAAKPDKPAAPVDFKWTEAPTVDMIPDRPVSGMVNGKPFEARSALIVEDGSGRRTIAFNDQPLDVDDALLDDGTEVSFDFTDEVRAGMSFERAMDGGPEPEGYAAFYHYEQADGGPMSVNRDFSVALQIDEGEDRGYDTAEGAPFVQVTGAAKGKIALCFDDKDDKEGRAEPSFIAGTFEAKIRYWGPPQAAAPAAGAPARGEAPAKGEASSQ
jgi:hypothetical protein